MTYRVTPVQYAKLVEARDGWPERLSFLWRGPRGDDCTAAYLTRVAGLNRQEVEGHKLLVPFISEGLDKLSQAYGVPKHEIYHLFLENNSLFVSGRGRSKKVFHEFRRLLNKVEVIPEPTETYAPSEECVLV